MNGASAALAISDIPWGGPIGAVRVGLFDDGLRVNPLEPDMATSRLDLVVAAGGLVLLGLVLGPGIGLLSRQDMTQPSATGASLPA